jgi:hypothetical protein
MSSSVLFVAAARRTARSTKPTGWVSGGHALSRRVVAQSRCAVEYDGERIYLTFGRERGCPVY